MNRAYSVVLPDETTTLLLRACVLTGAVGSTAFEDWLARVGDPFAALRAGNWRTKAILPLLWANLRQAGHEPPSTALRAHLRAAAERERLRTEPHRDVVASVLATVAADDHTIRLLASGVLAETAYPAPELRHNYGVELLVFEDEISGMARTLRRIAEPAVDDETRFLHPSTVPITLRTRFTPECYAAPRPDAASASADVELSGHRCATLTPESMLAQVCAQAFTAGAAAGDVTWIPDAWFTLASTPHFDWDALVSTVDERGWSIPVATTLSYLARELGLPIRDDALASLVGAANQASRTDRDLAMAFAWPAAHRSADPRRFRLSPRDACAFARWRLAPSPGFMRATRPVEGPGDLALAYARRPLTFLRRRAHSFRGARRPT